MASVTVTRPDLFPTGTSVSAYLALGRGTDVPASGPPPGSAVSSGTVAADGSLTITGLTEGGSYVLYAPSPDRYLRVKLPPLASIHGASHAPGGLDDLYLEGGHASSQRAENMPRWAAQSNLSTASGVTYLCYLTPKSDLAITQLLFGTRTTASSGLTLARVGLYTVDVGTGDVTLVARSASDTNLFNATSTRFAKSLDTTGGFPASYLMLRGVRYAIGVIQVGTTPASFTGASLGPDLAGGETPQMFRQAGSQADLQSLTNAQLSSNAGVAFYAAAKP